jgi:hypothetical protein
VVYAEEVQGVRRFGSEADIESLQDLLNDKLETMSNKHDITLEFLRWGAVRGQILDADGSTILNLFDEFAVTQEVQNFALTTSSTEVMSKITALKRYLELNLFGDTMSGILVFCSSGFFDALITHPSIKTAYQYFQKTQDPLTQDVRTRFVHGGVIFEEQNGYAKTVDGTTRKFIDDDTAQVVPLGTQSMKTYFAPADFMETVNTPGLPRYAKQERMKYDRGLEIHTQSNPLPVCLRPQLLVKLTKS